MSIFGRHFWKFLAGLLALILLGLSVAYGTHFYTNQQASLNLIEKQSH